MLSDPRQVIERLCAERREDFASLSRMLGKNPAYIQQFVRRGVPRRLKEAERSKLARYFSIPESMLGGPSEESVSNGLVERLAKTSSKLVQALVEIASKRTARMILRSSR